MDISEKLRSGQRRIIERKLFPRKLPGVNLLSLQKIIVFLGGRRTGKTSLMIQIMQGYLQENKVQIDNVIYIDFSELDNKNTDLIALYQSYKGGKPFFILDEIQELDNFESQVLFLYNEGCLRYFSPDPIVIYSDRI